MPLTTALIRIVYLVFAGIESTLLRIFDSVAFAYGASTNALLGMLPGGPVPYKAYQPSLQFHPVLLITGTSSGIGHELALRSALDGYIVVAGVRKDEDGRKLLDDFEKAKQDRLRYGRMSSTTHTPTSQAGHAVFQKGEILPIILDVTSAEHITSARKQVEKVTFERRAPFAGLVNNAGCPLLKPIELTSGEEMRKVFEINLFGPFDLIREFMPLIRRDTGRIVNVGSILGEVSTKLSGTYSGTKAAMRAMTSSLRKEMREFGISVTLISPGAIKTPLFGKEINTCKPITEDEQYLASISDEATRKIYRTISQKRLNISTTLAEVGLHPLHVYQSFYHAVTSHFPLATYHVGWDSRAINLASGLMSERMMDMLTNAVENMA